MTQSCLKTSRPCTKQRQREWGAREEREEEGEGKGCRKEEEEGEGKGCRKEEEEEAWWARRQPWGRG